jgi:hypothetical protein
MTTNAERFREHYYHCRLCLPSEHAPVFDCPHCAGTGREPCPFPEVPTGARQVGEKAVRRMFTYI